ncbi:response regulator [Lutimaribacter sp. EGI FJ00015]|uniref:Response regulator n=1 Tax=Lutimaribacter degradans TaxID=2945989 RepID=A0ACC5ZVW6_9RHOB|nr:response regulator [Lutimaribacter sp. EGI FJ00013]MCM2562212.1 response regulator [Lutimaribacter sp. EGI FJ00013]MCO0613367.1 response regulator [Lutimaribacter sp. EGI FJ00015]MCO0636341.1 response regulator [Lutimaribacter sp. EGI FJ00014]
MTAPSAPLILCCEDEPALRRDIADELREAGYRVREAANADEVFDALGECTPDLVLCDIMMPGTDGYGVLAGFRKDFPHLQHVPLVFLSALATTDALIRGKRAGADDYLTKPINYDLLISTIEARLRQTHRVQQSSAPVERIGWHLFDQLSVGVLAFDANCSLVRVNPAAENLLSRSAHPDTALGIPPGLAKPLRQMVRAALEKREETQAVRLDDEAAGMAVMFSCPAEGQRADPKQPAVFVYVTDPQYRTPLSGDALKSLFSLTPAETEVARRLAMGLRLNEIATDLGVSQTTVSFHLRNVFDKTGTNRQVELVALLLSLPLRAVS